MAKVFGIAGVVMGFNKTTSNLGFGLLMSAFMCVGVAVGLCIYEMRQESADKKLRRIKALVEKLGLDQATAAKVVNID